MESRSAFIRAVIVACVSMLFLLGGAVEAQIYLNEIRITPAQVELYNRGASVVDLSNWRIEGSLGEYVIPSGTTINPGEYKLFVSLGGIFEPIGGLVGLLDDVGSGTIRDRVRYGVFGGAPSAPPSTSFAVSMSRSPDASNNPAPPLIPNADELFWTLDFTSTFGAMNDVPNPNLGSSLCINEMLADPQVTLASAIELCNPPVAFTMGGDVDLSDGYLLSTAFEVQELTGVVPAGDYLGITLDDALDLPTAFRVDLFAPDGTRIFQKSTYGAPEPRNTCYGDCPNGSAPADGYDFYTCGGYDTFFPLQCSIGFANYTVGDEEGCIPAALPDDGTSPEVLERSWGEIKRAYEALIGK
ncbi:MAG: lamin tail domain-containing protein [Candidatus Eisenbacteria bacterium]